MENEFEKDDFLARWHANELSEKQRIAFEASEEYPYYKAILEGTDLLAVPKYDKDTAYKKIKAGALADAKKARRTPAWLYAVAAGMLLFFGLWSVFNTQDTTYETRFGERLTVSLPDGSKASLNATSRLSFDADAWENERTVSLDGEAFFKVEKGASFTVATKKGTVTVLGTQFSVATVGGVFEIVCFEGKVGVTDANEQQLLTKGQALRLVNQKWERYTTAKAEPAWLQERSVFKNAPLSQVLDALSKQYGKAIDASKIDINQRFTGGFTHNDLRLALETICESMEITYIFKDDTTIVFVAK